MKTVEEEIENREGRAEETARKTVIEDEEEQGGEAARKTEEAKSIEGISNDQPVAQYAQNAPHHHQKES